MKLVVSNKRKEIQQAKAETIRFQIECGAFFRKYRALRGNTEGEVAEILRVDVQFIHDYESGKKAIPLDQVDALARFLAIPFDEIMELHLKLEKKLMPLSPSEKSQPEQSQVDARLVGKVVQQVRKALFLSEMDLALLLSKSGYAITQKEIETIESGAEPASAEFWVSFCHQCHLDLDSARSYSHFQHFARLYEAYKSNALRIPAGSKLINSIKKFQDANEAESYKLWYLFRFSMAFKRRWLRR